jgi:hypothetical protein
LERSLAQGGLIPRKFEAGGLVFTIARGEDAADLRRLLRDNATDGWIRLSLAREPDPFVAAAAMGSQHGYIIARQDGEPVGMCEWSARESFVDGEVRLLAYIGALRVAPAFRHRVAVLKGGFEAVRRLLHHGRATPYALTAIAADNRAALRLLNANLGGMPTYTPLEPFSTFALRPRSATLSVCVERARSDDLAAIAVCLARTYRRYQWAPLWQARDLIDPRRCPGLNAEDFLIIRRGAGIAACLALWDQGAFKQTIVRGYAGWLGRLRPVANLVAPLAGMPRLPAAGEVLRQVYLSHVAVEGDDERLFRELIDAALVETQQRGFALALTGLAERHPLSAVLRRHYRPREYKTLLHIVNWGASPVAASSQRLPHVEIAVM